MRIIHKATFLVTFSLAIGAFSFGQKPKSDSVAILARAIANSDIYEVGYTVGYSGSISQQYQRFQRLVFLATEQQLIDLASRFENPVVRLYAFQALRQKKANISEVLFKQFQNDKTIVTMLKGCIGDKKTVNDLAKQNLNFPGGFIQ